MHKVANFTLYKLGRRSSNSTQQKLIHKGVKNMVRNEDQEVVIVGAGIAGLATALALKRYGIQSLVLESSDELRVTGTALGLFPNAFRALEVLGVADKLLPYYRPYQSGSGRIMDLVKGVSQEFTFNGTGGRAMTLHRKALMEALAEELPTETICFSSRVASIKTQMLQDSSLNTILHLEDGEVIRTKILIGCDGVNSVVAKWLGLSAPIASGRSTIRGLTVYPEGHGLDGNHQQFIGIDKRAGFFPLDDKDIYWFITHISTENRIRLEKEMAGDPERIWKDANDNLAVDFLPEYREIVRRSDPSQLTWAPLKFRHPWDILFGPTHKGSVVVAGDAMHPMTPDMAQGGCSALEDAVVLGRCIGTNKHNPIAGIEKFVQQRRWRVAGLVAGSYLTGWVQFGWSGILGMPMRWFRDNIFYKIIYPKILEAINYDCGDLPAPGAYN